MTRTVGGSFATHIAGQSTKLAAICAITRTDGTIHRFTTATDDMVVSSQTYDADDNFRLYPAKYNSDGSVSQTELDIPLGGNIDVDDVVKGKFSDATVQISWITYDDTTRGTVTRFYGTVGEVDYADETFVKIEVRSLLARGKAVFSAITGPGCRADLGSTRWPFACRLPLIPADAQRSTAYSVGDYHRIAQGSPADYQNRMFKCTTAGTTDASEPAYDYTVSNTTTDGSAVFTAEEAWIRSATVATVTDTENFTVTITESRAIDGWFTLGLAHWQTGNLAGLVSNVRKWTQSTSAVSLWDSPGFEIQVGDTLFLTPGCDKQFATCRDRFSNEDNFQGEENLPIRSVA